MLNRAQGYSPECSFVFLPCLQSMTAQDLPCVPMPQEPDEELPYTPVPQTQVLKQWSLPLYSRQNVC